MSVASLWTLTMVFATSALLALLVQKQPGKQLRIADRTDADSKAEALRLLREAAEQNPTAGRSVGGKGALSDLVRPQQISMKDWEDGLRLAHDLRDPDSDHVRKWTQMTSSPAAVNFLSYGTTFPFYMPPIDYKRLVIVDLVLPLQPEQGDPELYPTEKPDGSAISSDMIGTVHMPGYGNALYLEVWPREEKKCSPPGCPLVVFFLGGHETVNLENLTSASRSPNCKNPSASFDVVCKSALSQPLGRWAGYKKQLEELGVVVLAPMLSTPHTWSGRVEFSDLLVLPLVRQVLAKRKGIRMMVDPNRVYTTGLSEGGFGAMQTALRHPHVFSFSLVFALGYNEAWYNSTRWQQPSSSQATQRKLKEVVIVQGAQDMPRQGFGANGYGPRKLDIFQNFLDAHTDVRITYRVWPKQGHFTWFRGYVGARNFLWLGCPLPWENRTGGPALSAECSGKISDGRKVRAVATLCILVGVAVLSMLRECVRGKEKEQCSKCFGQRSANSNVVMPNTCIDERASKNELEQRSKTVSGVVPTRNVDSWDGPRLVHTIGNQPLPDVDVMMLIQQQARRTPFATALETETGHLWSFRDLIARILALVHRIHEESPVTLASHVAALRCGLLSMGGAESLLGLLGILHAGRCVVPLDTRSPDSRLSFLVSESHLQVAVVGWLSSGLEHARGLGIKIVVEVQDLASPQWRPYSKDMYTAPTASCLVGEAYMNYTSGTTGKPKAIISMHRGVLSHSLAAAQILTPQSPHVSLLLTPPMYGFHMCQLFPFLQVGAKIVLPQPMLLQSPSRIWEGVAGKAGVSFVAMVPSILDPQLGGAALGMPKSLRLIKCSGESLGGVTVLRTLAQHRNLQFVNWWGNTECLGCTAVRMDSDAARWVSEGAKGLPETTGRCPPLSQALPVGLPVGWRVLHLLPAECQGKSLDEGESEACVTGPAVCPPYPGRPKEASAAFVDSHFGPGNVLRTGDVLVQLNVPKESTPYSLRYVGRKDFQVKVNGVRIELGEIEEVAMELDGIDKCVVKLHATYLGDQLVKQLVAYVVGQNLPASVVQAHIAQHLPKAMVPHQVVYLKEFPRNDADKIDRNALTPPVLKLGEEGTAMMDSLGFQRIIVSRDEVWSHHASQAIYSLVPFCLLYAHWCPHNLEDVTSETDSNILSFLEFLHHIRILNVTAMFMGMSDKTSRQYYSPIKSFVWVAVLYLLMGWPRIFPGTGGFATLHRWTFLAILIYKILILMFDMVRLPIPHALTKRVAFLQQSKGTMVWIPIPPVLVVFIVLCIAPIFQSVSLDIWAGHGALTIWCEIVSDTGRASPGDQILPWIETTYYGSPNGTLASWTLLFAYYFAGYHFGLRFFAKQRAVIMNFAQRGHAFVFGIRIAAALTAVGLAWIREVADTPMLPPNERLYKPMNTWDWPNYYDGFYPLRVVADILFALLLTIALCDGSWAWNLVGRNLLFTFLGHMIITVDIPALLDASAPAGTFLQVLVLFLLPYVYSLSVGSFLFEIVVQCGTLLRGKPRSSLFIGFLICFTWFIFVLLGVICETQKIDLWDKCSGYA